MQDPQLRTHVRKHITLEEKYPSISCVCDSQFGHAIQGLSEQHWSATQVFSMY